MNLYIRQLELGPLQNFVYLVGSLETKEAIVVDPAWDVPSILKAAKEDGMKIVGAFVTHTHFDHVNGVEELIEATDAQVFVHKEEAHAIPIAKSNLRPIDGGDAIPIGSFHGSVLHTPGHTPGSACLTIADRLISGDTLFIGGCGRCDLPGGDPEALYRSLVRLRQMDDRTILYPGHHYARQPTSSLGQERQYNPFLNAPSLQQFLGLVGRVARQRG